MRNSKQEAIEAEKPLRTVSHFLVMKLMKCMNMS